MKCRASYFPADLTEHCIRPCCDAMKGATEQGTIGFRKIGRSVFNTLGLAIFSRESEQPIYFCPFCGVEIVSDKS